MLVVGSFSFRGISPTEISKVISELKVGCASGPDGLEAKFIKLASQVLIFPHLFNLSISTCQLPSIWKCAKVTPIFKGGDPLEVSNYRPISIICSTVKILEKLVFNQLSKYISDLNILSPFQSGFRANFSTTTTLVKFTNDVFSALGNSKLVGAIFIDLTKAFDLVDHYLLLDKLYNIGLSRQALLWFSSYLHNRRQSVCFNSSQSDFLVVEKGVPQGSILGPLLFSIFINDLPKICKNCSIQLYADDTAIYTSDSDQSKIQSTLQTEFNLVQEWLLKECLVLNKKKTCGMLFGTRYFLNRTASDLSVHFPDGSPLKTVQTFKYLGLWLDSELSFQSHVDSIRGKVNNSLRLMYRSINCFTPEIRKHIVQQLLLPIIDYCDIVYQNTSDTHLHSLNVTYNNICRFVLRCPYTTHHCVLYDTLNWLSPQSRRQFHWLIFIFKCIHFNYPSYLKQLLNTHTSSYALRNIQQPYFKVPTNIKKETGRRSFQFKAPMDWNNLPTEIRTITAFPAFKMSLIYSPVLIMTVNFISLVFIFNFLSYYYISYYFISFVIYLNFSLFT